MILPHPIGPEGAAGFFIRSGEKDQISIELRARFLDGDKCCEFAGDLALHIQSTTPPNEAIVIELAAERIAVPLLAFNGHHINVTHEHDRLRRWILG